MIDLKIGDPFPIFVEKNKKSVTILNDWNTPFCFGTKLRKAEGFYREFLKKSYKAIQIAGDPNSNFMAAFTLYFYSKKIPVLSILSSKSGFRSGNRILSERFSSQIQWLPAIPEDFFFNPHPQFIETGEKGNGYSPSEILVVPKWGASLLGVSSLHYLWDHIYTRYKVKILYLDVGSGATFLSALHYFREKNICVIGICIGLPLAKMQRYLEKWELQEFGIRSQYSLLEPSMRGRFGKRKKVVLNFIKEMKTKECYLEPIYSGVSLHEIFEGNSGLHGEGVFYLHQGGLLPHLIHEE